MKVEDVIARLEKVADPEYREGLKRYNLPIENALGVRVPNIRKIAKEIGKDHDLALQLWESPWRECRVVATMIADPERVTEELMEEWAAQFDSWGICDCCCGYLFDKTPYAYGKAREWSEREEEFVKRAGFSLIACLAVNDKQAEDKTFLDLLPIIKRESHDKRNFVKKAVNWALREIGKRNLKLNKAAIKTAEEIVALDTKAGKWIAKDALRELRSDSVQQRLKKKEQK